MSKPWLYRAPTDVDAVVIVAAIVFLTLWLVVRLVSRRQ